MSDIGVTLAELRKNAGYTQQRLGEKLGVSHQHISRVESGARQPSWRYIVDLAKLVNIPPDDLLRRAGYVEGAASESELVTLVTTDPDFAELVEFIGRDRLLLLEMLKYARYYREGSIRPFEETAEKMASVTRVPIGSAQIVDPEALTDLVKIVADKPELQMLLHLWRKVPEDVALLVKLARRLTGQNESIENPE